MPVRLSTFLRNTVFCPPFQAFRAKCKSLEKVPTVIRIGQPVGIRRGNSFCRPKNGIRTLNAPNEQSYMRTALLLTLRERPFLARLLAYQAKLV